MPKAPLNKESQFTVGEEKTMNYMMALFFFILFSVGIGDAILRRFKNIDYQSYVFVFAIIPAIYCIRRAHSKRVYLRINKKGIYQDERLVTDWSNFIKAAITQKEKTGIFNIQDNFQMILEFRGKETKQGIRKKIPLTNSQNKSEEDLMAAISFFWNEYKKGQY